MFRRSVILIALLTLGVLAFGPPDARGQAEEAEKSRARRMERWRQRSPRGVERPRVREFMERRDDLEEEAQGPELHRERRRTMMARRARRRAEWRDSREEFQPRPERRERAPRMERFEERHPEFKDRIKRKLSDRKILERPPVEKKSPEAAKRLKKKLKKKLKKCKELKKGKEGDSVRRPEKRLEEGGRRPVRGSEARRKFERARGRLKERRGNPERRRPEKYDGSV